MVRVVGMLVGGDFVGGGEGDHGGVVAREA